MHYPQHEYDRGEISHRNYPVSCIIQANSETLISQLRKYIDETYQTFTLRQAEKGIRNAETVVLKGRLFWVARLRFEVRASLTSCRCKVSW